MSERPEETSRASTVATLCLIALPFVIIGAVAAAWFAGWL